MDPGAQARLATSLGNIAQKVSVSGAASVLGENASVLPGFAANGEALSKEASNQEGRIYVGSMAFDVTAEEVKRLFSPFGVVQKIDMSKGDGNNKGGSKGFCFIWFQDTQSAMAALTMDGFQLGDRQIKVGLPSDNADASKELNGEDKDKCGPLTSYAIANGSPYVLILNIPSLLSSDMLTSVVASFGEVVSCVAVSSSQQQQQSVVPPPPQMLEQAQGQESSIWSGQVQFSSVESAYMLLMAFSINGVLIAGNLITAQSLRTPIKAPAPPAVSSSSTSSSSGGDGHGRQVWLIGMSSWTEARSEGAALEKEIAAECARYGVLLDVSIEPGEDDQAVVLLEYEDREGAARAVEALHNRYFAGRRIRASLTPI